MRLYPTALIAAALVLGACTQPPVAVVYGTGASGKIAAKSVVAPLPAPSKPAANVLAVAPPPEPPLRPQQNTTQAAQAATMPAAIRIQTGDTVYAIARRHGASVRDIIAANHLTAPYKLLVGQTLRLPSGRYHMVLRGETIHTLSRRYDVSMSALVRLNDIPPPYRLTPGTTLRDRKSVV